jgi:hypothetical protein
MLKNTEHQKGKETWENMLKMTSSFMKYLSVDPKMIKCGGGERRVEQTWIMTP